MQKYRISKLLHLRLTTLGCLQSATSRKMIKSPLSQSHASSVLQSLHTRRSISNTQQHKPRIRRFTGELTSLCSFLRREGILIPLGKLILTFSQSQLTSFRSGCRQNSSIWKEVKCKREPKGKPPRSRRTMNCSPRLCMSSVKSIHSTNTWR